MNADLAPDRLLACYASGIFPMADDDGNLHWLSPDPRAVIELSSFRESRSLKSVVRRGVFDLSINRAFATVIDCCADRSEGTWISADIKEAYRQLHRLGFAHSVETWQNGELTGGLYGVTVGGAFFGESMFHRATDASKVALVHLVQRLRDRGFTLLDVQFLTGHLRRLGAVEVSRKVYEQRLAQAVQLPCRFSDEAPDETIA